MALSFETFLSAHRGLVDELHGGLSAAGEPAFEGLSREIFARALWKSGAKAGVAEEKIPAFLRGLRLRDLALGAACASGSENAWTAFVAEMRGPLRTAGRAMAGDRGEELADALFGELYAARESKLGSYCGRSSLGAWLRAVLYQTYIDRLRAEKRLVSLDAAMDAAFGDPGDRRGGPSVPEPASPPAPDPVEQAEYARIASKALEQALAALPPRQKLLLDFYYFHGLTLREAAALVKVHEATASRELDRARGTLKKLLTQILTRDYRLGEQEMRACLYTAVQGGLEWSARGVTSERS